MATGTSTGPEVQINFEEELFIPLVKDLLKKGERSRLRLVVLGEAGIGKSSIINGLVGKEVATVEHSIKKGTKQVEKCKEDPFDNVTIWDTPGFGFDDEKEDEEVLKKMVEECKPVDLLLFCIRMDKKRWPERSDRDTIKVITEHFGRGVWNHCLFVLTFANKVVDSCPNREEKEVFFSEIK